VPNWRGFQNFTLFGEFDSSSVRSAYLLPTPSKNLAVATDTGPVLTTERIVIDTVVASANDEVHNSETAQGEGQDEKDHAFQSHDECLLPAYAVHGGRLL
jgi:hypothetical protein